MYLYISIYFSATIVARIESSTNIYWISKKKMYSAYSRLKIMAIKIYIKKYSCQLAIYIELIRACFCMGRIYIILLYECTTIYISVLFLTKYLVVFHFCITNNAVLLLLDLSLGIYLVVTCISMLAKCISLILLVYYFYICNHISCK